MMMIMMMKFNIARPGFRPDEKLQLWVLVFRFWVFGLGVRVHGGASRV